MTISSRYRSTLYFKGREAVITLVPGLTFLLQACPMIAQPLNSKRADMRSSVENRLQQHVRILAGELAKGMSGSRSNLQLRRISRRRGKVRF